ncbi:class I SAM-dependent methyltransferase [Herpetosiphon geysericola]|uniref:Methyltransferase type 11 domain-containing protein n=1 Tax=Herpetosiphon geysericola TaxID=70996 RepID=A0A0P6XSP1_9CHLR|nr:class I SAM-dependent methyltransferase [Herpetosiphon geysericola]KPL85984.1 hypothetical protein SE18_13905 [Herpetosiphon geysericola]
MAILPKILRRYAKNSSRVYLEQFVQQAAQRMQPGQRMLDAGAGDAAYQRFFQHVTYESADFCQVDKAYATMTYVCDLAAVPVEDQRYDLILLTQVLEHLPEPQLVLKEMLRLLKPNGTLWLSAPLFYEEHEVPFDFYRYTQFGFQQQLTQAGFQVEQTQWLEGYYGTLAYQADLAVRSLRLNPRFYGGGWAGLGGSLAALLLRPILVATSLLFSRLDLHYKFTEAGMCKNYALIARKPA